MPRLELPSGKVVLLRINHFGKARRRRGKRIWERATRVEVIMPELTVLTGVAVCSVKDNFCRRTGIKVAVERLLLKGRQKGIAEEDLLAIEKRACAAQTKVAILQRKYAKAKLNVEKLHQALQGIDPQQKGKTTSRKLNKAPDK